MATAAQVPITEPDDNTANTLEFQRAMLHLASRTQDCRCDLCVLIYTD